jgi:hypothetical protein
MSIDYTAKVIVGWKLKQVRTNKPPTYLLDLGGYAIDIGLGNVKEGDKFGGCDIILRSDTVDENLYIGVVVASLEVACDEYFEIPNYQRLPDPIEEFMQSYCIDPQMHLIMDAR